MTKPYPGLFPYDHIACEVAEFVSNLYTFERVLHGDIMYRIMIHDVKHFFCMVN